MRLCELCGAESKIRLAKRGRSEGKYFWGCSKFPECNYTQDTILNQIPKNVYWSHINHNSMQLIYPEDIVSDAERHLAIKMNYEYNHPFAKDDFTKMDYDLGFQNKSDFYFWIASQKRVVNLGVHNYFPVGSPYYFTFTNLVMAINRDFDNIIDKTFIEKNDLINPSIEYWLNLFRRENEDREERLRISSEKEYQRHQDGIKRRAEKATANIFNAIRRKDIKAIIALRKAGADMTYKNENGFDCFEYAKTINDNRILEALTCELKDEI